MVACYDVKYDPPQLGNDPPQLGNETVSCLMYADDLSVAIQARKGPASDAGKTSRILYNLALGDQYKEDKSDDFPEN